MPAIEGVLALAVARPGLCPCGSLYLGGFCQSAVLPYCRSAPEQCLFWAFCLGERLGKVWRPGAAEQGRRLHAWR